MYVRVSECDKGDDAALQVTESKDNWPGQHFAPCKNDMQVKSHTTADKECTVSAV